MWMSEVADAVSRLGESTTEEVASSVEKALGLNWLGDLKPVAAGLTTAAYLRALSMKGQIQESEQNKKGKKIWRAT
jgi:hypothetical protein